MFHATLTIHWPESLGRNLNVQSEFILRLDRTRELNEPHSDGPAIIRPITATKAKIWLPVRNRWTFYDTRVTKRTIEVGQHNVTGLYSSHIVVKVSMATFGIKFRRPQVLPEYLISPRLILIHPPVRRDGSLRRLFLSVIM